ncbi:mediator complex subunit 13 C-terminal-domain-containing protein [Microdochium trichocladiopsis]|uniref:Mediator of RNA polymerase II transcription subunit 13 n=1 Tax=Microdochium trichocladiopsis TaxID=1682393 RepID=A0A9P8YHS8_9PEZI|nr:mediator complex subunit 13 C-terminal-domain-containing protein [Microdochium trichocladiopsis]KAH7040252.1 mediator complex subunit 13 C-terminal-domain-containing protein [Microdochium trichocladiopsis]
MDIGEYDTNALLINNIASVSFAFYEPSVSASSSSLSPSIIQLESQLRKDGLLAYVEAARRRVWCFRLVRRDVEADATTAGATSEGFPKIVEGGGYTLPLVEEGVFEPASLAKTRNLGPNANATPNSSASSTLSAAVENTFRTPQSTAAGAGFPAAQIGQNVPAGQDSKALVPVEAKPSALNSPKEAYEPLMSAILSAVSAAFCAATGALPLSPRTLLLAQPDKYASHASTTLASLRIYLTTTGTLIISMNLSQVEGLMALTDYRAPRFHNQGITVLAAPFGVFATCQATLGADGITLEANLAQTPDTLVVGRRPDKESLPWRTICAKILHARSIKMPLGSSRKWLNLQRMRRKPLEQKTDGKRTPVVGISPNISWPSALLFCKAFSKMSIRDSTEPQSTPTQARTFDPLSNARSWFMSAGEREAAVVANKKNREAASASAALAATMTAGNAAPEHPTQPVSALSPLAVRQTGAVGPAPATMYLTPPDGVPNVAGATPSLDAPASSPVNHAAAAAAATTAVDATSHSSAPVEPAGEDWDGSKVKPERQGSSTFDSDNLFGELGPDMFGDNNITEDDFDFFDEQQPGQVGLGTLDLPSMPSTQPDFEMGNTLPGGQESHDAEVKDSQPPLPAEVTPAQPEPVFAKPELKHARSSIKEEEQRRQADNKQRQISSSTKRPSSPFDPATVYKRIKASLDNHKAAQQNSRVSIYPNDSIFDKVSFGSGLSFVNSKYEGNGRFDFSVELPNGVTSADFDGPPTTEYLRRHSKVRQGLQQLSLGGGHPYSRVQAPGGQNAESPMELDDSASDADELSLVSDEEDSSYESDEPTSPQKVGALRRKRNDEDGDSLTASFKELESLDVVSPSTSMDIPRAVRSETELPLVKYFADPEPVDVRWQVADEVFMMAAQILAEHAATTTMHIGSSSQTSLRLPLEKRRDLLDMTRAAMQDLKTHLPSSLGAAECGHFRPVVDTQDVPLLGPPGRMQPRPPGVEHMKPSNLFQIPTPRFDLRRYESKMSVVPSAISFWESLGLGPSQGPKDISAISIFPNFAGLSEDALLFVDRMRSMYESLKLGSLTRFPTNGDFADGLVPVDTEKHLQDLHESTTILGASLFEQIGKLAKALAAATAQKTNFVVFFVYLSDVPGSLAESCIAFHHLFDAYKKVLLGKRLPVVNELVLQLVPVDMISASTSLVVPAPFDISRLAIELYDRCTLFDGSMPSPAIVLEQPPPRVIDFKLTANPSASLMRENTCLHVAYAQSVDERWITAAWTDNWGNQQMTAAYCLGRKGKPIATAFADVAHEIWETTRELMATWKIHWRVMLAKCGIMDQHEIDVWSGLAQGESKVTASLTLITVETDPSLQILPQPSKVPSSAPTVFYTTPVSTPQAGMVSPEQSGNPPTPMRESTATSAPTPGAGDGTTDFDADASLIDVTDQAWGAVLAHRLNNSTSATELSPALVSGYLVKRSGNRGEDPPAVMEVNLVYTDNSPRAYEALMRELLTYYRGLTTLARARGVVERTVDARPWHVAAAEKAVRTLYMAM